MKGLRVESMARDSKGTTTIQPVRRSLYQAVNVYLIEALNSEAFHFKSSNRLFPYGAELISCKLVVRS